MLLDTYGRSINYARISVTDLCNLRCVYCMSEDGITKKKHEDILRIEEIIAISDALVSCGINKIRLTGGEPLVRKGIIAILNGIGTLNGLKTLALTTNGVLLPKYMDELRNANVNALNISLDTLDKEKFRKITRIGNIDDVLCAVKQAESAGFESVKINTVLIKGFNDDEVSRFIELTVNSKIDVRFIELMALGTQVDWTADKYLSNDFVINSMKELIPIKGSDPSSPAMYYKLKGAKGRVGLISPISCKFCSKCNRIRITADGKIKPCLHTNDEIDLKNAVNDKEKLIELIKQAVNLKPESHRLTEKKHVDRDMFQIGG